MPCCVCRYLCMSNKTRQTNFKRQIQDWIFNSSSICSHPGVLASFNCSLHLCFCLLSRSLSPRLFSANLKLSEPHMQHRGKKKKKLKPRCLVYFHSQNMTDGKIEGSERKHSRRRRQLWNLGEPTATNLGFTGGAVVHCGKSGWHSVVFQEERERETENKSIWQQMKLAGCGVLFPPARSNEQALRTDWGNWSPVGLGAFSFSSVRGVRHTWKHTHTCGHTRVKIACTRAEIHSVVL